MARARTTGLTGESGITLVELIVGMALSLIVLGAVVTSFVSQLSSQNRSSSRADSAQEVIPGIERMTRDIRAAKTISVTGTNVIDLTTPERNGATASTVRRVIYDCSSGSRCTRDEGLVTVSGNPTTVIDRVQNSDIFTTTASPVDASAIAFVAIKLRVAISAPAGRVVEYRDGVNLRNVATSS